MSDKEEETLTVLSNQQLTEAFLALNGKLDKLLATTESESAHPYGLSELDSGPNIGRKRKKGTALPSSSTQSKRLKAQEIPQPRINNEDPYISLPEEEEMNQNVRDLLGENSEISVSDSEEDSENCGHLFAELSREINNDEDNGPAIEENLMTCFNSVWQKPLNKEKYLEKLKQFKIPSNVNITVKKCNEEIWKNKMSTKTKTLDLKLQKIQTALTKTTAAIIQDVSSLTKFLGSNKEKYISRRVVKERLEKSIKTSLDAVTLLSSASSYTDEVRREGIAQFLPHDIRNCVNASEADHASPRLFGDHLTKKVSEWKMSMKSIDKNWYSEPKTWRELDHRTSKNYRPFKGQRGNKRGSSYKRGQRKKSS